MSNDSMDALSYVIGTKSKKIPLIVGNTEYHSMGALKRLVNPDVIDSILAERGVCDRCGANLITIVANDGEGETRTFLCPKHEEDVLVYELSFKKPPNFERKDSTEGICTGRVIKGLKTQNIKPEENNSDEQAGELEKISRERDLWKKISEMFFDELKDADSRNKTHVKTKKPPIY